MVGPLSSSMTPDLIASSRVRYSLTETLSLAARSVKKKLMSMGRRRPVPDCRRGYTPEPRDGLVPAATMARMPALSTTEIAFLMVACQQAVMALGWIAGARLVPASRQALLHWSL